MPEQTTQASNQFVAPNSDTQAQPISEATTDKPSDSLSNAPSQITVFEAETKATRTNTGQRKRGRDTVSILLDELRKAKPTVESFNSVDRSLPAPASPASIVQMISSSKILFAQLHDSEEVSAGRTQFLESLCRYANEEQKQTLSELMLEFEKRVFISNNAQAEPEIYDTYKQLTILLQSAPTDRSLPWQSRMLAVSHFLIHAARPDTACLGSKIGAQVLCLIQKLISTRPSRLAEILSSASLDGEWRAFDGKVLKVDEHSLKPGPEELGYKAGDHKRSYAIKIWQSFLLNNCLIRRTVPMIYSETPGRPGKDYGGQILRTQDGKTVNPKLGANISFFELALLARFEFGESSCILVNDLSFGTQSPELLDASTQNMLLHFRTVSELGEILVACRDASRLPATVAVDERRLLAESYQDGINHAVNVVDFNEYGNLRIYNPLLLPGMQRSARISLQRLYNASLSNFKV